MLSLEQTGVIKTLLMLNYKCKIEVFFLEVFIFKSFQNLIKHYIKFHDLYDLVLWY